MFSRLAVFPAVLSAAYMLGAQAKELKKDDFDDLRIIRIMGRGCPKKSSVGDTVRFYSFFIELRTFLKQFYRFCIKIL